MRHLVRCATLCALLAAAVPALAQAPVASAPAAAPGATTKPIAINPMSSDPSKELVIIAVTLNPGAAVPMHRHPGDCTGVVADGTIEMLVEGQAPRRYTAGEAYANLGGVVHGFRNVGEGVARLFNTLVVDKNAPRTQPVTPAPRQ